MTDLSKPARRITWVLFANQCLASAGFIAAATINSILGAKLGGSDYWTGVPSAVYLLGAAFAASAWGYVMERIGRRNSMTLGLLLGVIGNTLVLFAIRASSLVEFLIGMVLMGITNAIVVLGRFVAAEVNPPQGRGKAISLVVWGGTFGAVVGPLLVGPTGNFVKTLGMDELAGAYSATLILFVIAAVVVFIGLRPDPRDLGREVAALYPESTPHGETRPVREILSQPAALTALMAMVLGQAVMVALMVITSLHMNHHQHGLTEISHVIQAHTIGMYAFSIVSGYLVDKWGRRQVILAGAGMLLIACITAPLSPDVLPLGIALFFPCFSLAWVGVSVL
jgi:MFS family permease